MTGAEHVQELARHFSVIPAGRDKLPLVKWKEFQTRRPSVEEIGKWFQGSANVAVVTGAISGIAVLDADDAATVSWCEANLPRTPTVETARGRHYYFRFAPGLKNAVSVNGHKLDVRGEGGYVIGPGSIHSTGVIYSWLEGRSMDDLPLAPFPTHLQTTKEAKTTTTGAYGQAALASELSQLAGSREGERNDALNRAAFSLAQLVEGGELERSAVEAALTGMAFSIGLSEPEARSTIKSGMEAGERDPRTAPEGRREPTTTTTETPEAPTTEKSSMALTSLGDLYDEPEVEVEYVVEDMLPVSGLSASVAKPKVGKSTHARQMCLAVATGSPFLGRATKQGPVLYYALEEKRSEVRRHFRDMGATGEEPIHIYAGSAGPDALTQMELAIRELAPVLIVIDPLFRLIRVKDGNDYATMSTALDPILRLARDSSAHVHVVHHAPKGEKEDAGESPLGSTAIFGSIDTLIILKRHPSEGYRTLQTIQRYGEDVPETLLTFDPVTRLTALGRSKGEEDMAGVCKRMFDYLSEQTTPISEAVIETDVHGRTGLKRKALRELVAAGDIIRHGKGGRKDPFTYSRVNVPLVPVVPVVPKNGEHGNKNPEKRPVQSSCFVVPAYSKNIWNNKQEVEDTRINIDKSCCSQVPAPSSCSREFGEGKLWIFTAPDGTVIHTQPRDTEQEELVI